MDRRTFLVASSAALLGACRKPWFLQEAPTPTIYRPGMAPGHWLRDGHALPAPTEEITTGVAILGSGIAGLACAWKLAREGFHDFVLVNGPEANGNAAAGRIEGMDYPRGAHYLPLPSMESQHVREMLFDLGIIEADPLGTHPTFDETALVHAPSERLLKDGKWHEELLSPEPAQHVRFLKQMATYRHAQGADGKKAFAIPRMLSSTDPTYTGLDAISMKQWLAQEGYDSRELHWYCDYACRDDYGTGYEQISAWAGIHYFASRGGLAANASAGAVLTWPGGLGTLAEKLRARLGATDTPLRTLDGLAVKVTQTGSGTESLILEPAGKRCLKLKARQVVLAMPLMMAARILTDAREGFGLDSARLPAYAPWLVGNIHLEGFPRELKGAPLAWDNVIYGSPGLGYVVATHQHLSAAQPEHTVFTAYRTLHDRRIDDARRWLHDAPAEALVETALADLHTAYPRRLMRHARHIEITLRAHAMSAPHPGFLADATLAPLRQGGGRVHFAHADLSGMSLFEEASWWGVQVGERLMRG